MKIQRCLLIPFSYAFTTPLKMLGVTHTHREGFYLQLETFEGMRGRGECAPLPGLMPQNLLEICRQKAQYFIAIIEKWPVGDNLQQLQQSLAQLYEKWQEQLEQEGKTREIPGVLKWAIEEALWQLLGQLYPHLNLFPQEVQVSYQQLLFIDDFVDLSSALPKLGHNTIKIKFSPSQEAQEKLFVLFERDFQNQQGRIWRLDANEQLSPAEYVQLSNKIQARCFANKYVEYIEDPFPLPDDPDEETIALLQQGHLKVALDAPVADWEQKGILWRNLELYGIKTIILKPILLPGFFYTMQFLEEAQKRGIQVVISSCFHTSSTLFTLAMLAQQLPATAHGLGTFSYLLDPTLANFPAPSPFRQEDGELKYDLAQYRQYLQFTLYQQFSWEAHFTFFRAGVALQDQNQKLTYEQLYHYMLWAREQLSARQLGAGDFLGLTANLQLEFFVFFLAAISLGITVAPIAAQLPSSRLQELQRDFNLKEIFTAPILPQFDLLNSVRERIYDLDLDLNSDLVLAPISALSFHQTCSLFFTSGSSGSPKGVLHSWGALLHSAMGSNYFFDVAPAQTTLLVLPVHHMGGLMAFLRSFLSGGCSLISAANDYHKMAQLLATEKVDYLSLVPTQLQKMLEECGKINFKHCLKVLLVGGGSLPQALELQARQLQLPLYISYGMTEMAATICVAGVTLPSRQIKIKITSGDKGQIVVGGSTLMQSYLLPGGHRQYPFNEAGFFETSDVGSMNEKGELTLLGRIDDIFISGGENIHPAEVEKVLLSFSPEIQQAYVVPVADAVYGQVGHALVVAPSKEKEQLQEFLRENLSPHQIPKKIIMLPPQNQLQNYWSSRNIKWPRSEVALLLQQWSQQAAVSPVQLRYQTLGKVGQPPLIFFHGFLGQGDDWKELAQQLAEKYFCLLLDLPGHGLTLAPDNADNVNVSPSSISFLNYIHHLHSILQNLPFPLQNPGLVGYSMGGRIAWTLATLYPQHYQKLFLISCHPGLPTPSERQERMLLDFKLAETLNDGDFLEKWYGLPIFGNLSKRPQFNEILHSKRQNFIPGLHWALRNFSLGLQPDLKEIKAPLKIYYLAGELDHKYSSLGKSLQEIFPHLTYSEVSGCGHALLSEDSEIVLQLIQESL